MSIFKRRREPPPPVPPQVVQLDQDQRHRVSMALQTLAENMRATVVAAESGPAALGAPIQSHRDRLMADAVDTERLAALFRGARGVEVRLDLPAAVLSNDITRERELASLVDGWAMVGVPPNAIAALLFRSGAQLFANLGIHLDELVGRLREARAPIAPPRGHRPGCPSTDTYGLPTDCTCDAEMS